MMTELDQHRHFGAAQCEGPDRALKAAGVEEDLSIRSGLSRGWSDMPVHNPCRGERHWQDLLTAHQPAAPSQRKGEL